MLLPQQDKYFSHLQYIAHLQDELYYLEPQLMIKIHIGCLIKSFSLGDRFTMKDEKFPYR